MFFQHKKVLMMNKHDYTDIPNPPPHPSDHEEEEMGTSHHSNTTVTSKHQHPSQRRSTTTTATSTRSKHRHSQHHHKKPTTTTSVFWDHGSFFRDWSLMKIVMLSMLLLLIGIVVFQGVEEQEELIQATTTIHQQQVVTNQNQQQQQQQQQTEQDDPAVSSASSHLRYAPTTRSNSSSSSSSTNSLPIPPGMNIGSWLSLEDYFFAGPINSREVATPGQFRTHDAQPVASCLPPLHVGGGRSTGPAHWYSETDLFQHLIDFQETQNAAQGGGGPLINGVRQNGTVSGIQYAIEVFQAHRSSYIDLDVDFAKIAALGITTIRLPMSWCLTEYDPRKIDLSAYTETELLTMFTCLDPFFKTEHPTPDTKNKEDADGAAEEEEEEEQTPPRIYWPAIPKPFIEDILRACARYKIRVTLDVHTYPGGTSIGTFSGVWPNWPRFWTHGGDGIGRDSVTRRDGDNGDRRSSNTASVTDNNAKANATNIHTSNHKHDNTDDNGYNIGFILFQELVSWMEELHTRDPVAFQGLRGLSPMNEPAHLAGNFDRNDPTNFLPPLPEKIGARYRARFISSNPTSLGSDFPDGTHLRVFRWFDGAIDIFRNSTLPKLGKELHANIHESIFQPLSDDSGDIDATKRFTAIATWWCSDMITDTNITDIGPTTTLQERTTWAVLDVHHYNAWSDGCSGTIDGQNNAGYACGDIEGRTKVLKKCSKWAQTFRNIIDEQCTIMNNKGGSSSSSTYTGNDDDGIDDSSASASVPVVKLVSGEFSAATYHNSRRSCNDVSGLRDSYTRQVIAGAEANIELMYWSYKMPYGGTFRQAWSFTQLMYNLGIFDRPDTPQFECDSNSKFDPDLPSS